MLREIPASRCAHTHLWDPRKNEKTVEDGKERVTFIVMNSLINHCANYYTAPNASINYTQINLFL